MRGWIKRTLLCLLVFGAAWGGALWYWDARDRSPDTGELLLFLLVLPLAVLALLWLGRALIALMLAAPAAAAAQDAPPPAAQDTAAPALPPLAIMGAALRCAHGATPEELAAVLKDHKALPALDSELLDDDGYPLMSARAALADSAASGGPLREDVGIWLALNGHPGVTFDDEQWRTLALGAAVAAELGEAAGAYAPPPLEKNREKDPAAPVQPVLRLMPIWPDHWQHAQRNAGAAWLRHVAAKGGWPASRIAVSVVAPDEPAVSPAPVPLLQALARHVASDPAPLLTMVLACASHVGHASVNRWSDQATLFTSGHPQGMIPGEGAAGLLLAGLAHADRFGPAPHRLLHSADAMRDSSADGARRADPTMLQTLAKQVLAEAASAPPAVALVLADTGHRTSRTMELMTLAIAATPQLDAGADVLRVGSAYGNCGAVPFVSALALAAHQAAELQAPVLCIGNEDPLRRSVALVLTAAPA